VYKEMLKDKLSAVVAKYRGHPEFLGIDIHDPNQKGAVDDTLLHIAARMGAVEDIEVLVGCGGHVNAIGDLGNTPLHYAAMSGQVESVKKLIELGADLDRKNEFGQTALDVANLGDHHEVAHFLKSKFGK
jgi:ankyrin repeat protein